MAIKRCDEVSETIANRSPYPNVRQHTLPLPISEGTGRDPKKLTYLSRSEQLRRVSARECCGRRSRLGELKC
jgi:hypothetical protein